MSGAAKRGSGGGMLRVRQAVPMGVLEGAVGVVVEEEVVVVFSVLVVVGTEDGTVGFRARM